MLEYGDFAYQTGLIDRHGYHAMKLFENLAKEYWPQIESKIVRLHRPLRFQFSHFHPISLWFLVLGHNFVCVHSKQPIQQSLQHLRTRSIGFGLLSWIYRTNSCECALCGRCARRRNNFYSSKIWHRFAKQFMLAVRVSSRPNWSTLAWFPISCQRQYIGRRSCSTPASALCITVEIWISSSLIHCLRMRIAKWNGRDSKNIERLAVNRLL